MNRLIGLTGRKQSGKSTAARYLRDTYGFRHADFADPIRALIAYVINTTVEDMEPVKELPQPALGGKTPRDGMKLLGTEWGRTMIHPDVWVMAMAPHIRTTPRLVIADVRFDNEAQLIVDHGGHIIEITRSTTTQDDHASEAGIDRGYIHSTISNDGHRIHLYNALDDVLHKLRRAAA